MLNGKQNQADCAKTRPPLVAAEYSVVATNRCDGPREGAGAFSQDPQLQQVLTEIAKFAKRISREMVVDLAL